MSTGTPTQEKDRIAALDTLRGFALLGILLLNILGFGLLSSAYFNPQVGSELSTALNLTIWGSVDVLFEGAMRGLFSMLFGAGVALFTEAARGRTAALHYKRTLWLLIFGVIDGFLLLWNGDILIVYALAGFLLYPARNASPTRLLIAAGVLLALMSGLYAVSNWGRGMAREAAELVATNPEADAQTQEMATAWQEFEAGFKQSPEAAAEELEQRRGSYASAFAWNLVTMTGQLLFVTPIYLFWDALMLMLVGMALYRMGVLSGGQSSGFYTRLMVFGFVAGITINAYEVYRSVSSGFDPLVTFGYMQWTYHFGRTSMALGWLGLVMLACQRGWWTSLQARLGAVGRMALTNYLMHSVFALVLFTGAGLGLVGVLQRYQLYLVVLAIWAFQLWFSPWWLARFRFGPVEWLWRWLTYGQKPALRRQTS